MNLALFMTYGGSLKSWEQAGILDRELALYREHVAQGVAVTIVSYGEAQDREMVPANSGIRVLANDRALHPRLYGWLLPRIHAPALADTGVIKTNQLYGASQALASARRVGCSFVLRQGYSHVEHRRREHGRVSRQARRAEAYERRYLPEADACLFTTEAMAAAAMERTGVPPAKAHVVPNFVEPETWTPAFARFRPFEVGTKVRAGFFGRFTEQKNLDGLIRAAAGLPIVLELIGAGPLRDDLLRLAAELEVEVLIPGRLPQSTLRSRLDMCDFFVLPSHYEGHPKALIEAMAFGMPVLATDSPGIDQEIKHGRTGLLSGADPEELRQGLLQMLALSPETRKAMAAAARNEALSAYALDRVAARERAILAAVSQDTP